jgi:hypothetical protein
LVFLSASAANHKRVANGKRGTRQRNTGVSRQSVCTHREPPTFSLFYFIYFIIIAHYYHLFQAFLPALPPDVAIEFHVCDTQLVLSIYILQISAFPARPRVCACACARVRASARECASVDLLHLYLCFSLVAHKARSQQSWPVNLRSIRIRWGC